MSDLHPERVPDVEEASVDDAKFTEYLLNDDHPQGRGKAKFFKSLGYSRDEWRLLRDGIVSQACRVPAQTSKENDFGGTHYEAVVRLDAPRGTVDVRTFWEVHPKTGTRFLTAYPLD